MISEVIHYSRGYVLTPGECYRPPEESNRGSGERFELDGRSCSDQPTVQSNKLTARARFLVRLFVQDALRFPVAVFSENEHKTFPIPYPEHLDHISNNKTRNHGSPIHTGLLSSPTGTKHSSSLQRCNAYTNLDSFNSVSTSPTHNAPSTQRHFAHPAP